MSALPPEADMAHRRHQCLLSAISGLRSQQQQFCSALVQPRAFPIFKDRCQRGEAKPVTGGAILVALI